MDSMMQHVGNAESNLWKNGQSDGDPFEHRKIESATEAKSAPPNMEFSDTHCKVALSGTIDDADRKQLMARFYERGIQVVTWGASVRALFTGAGAESHWKYGMAHARGLPIIDVKTWLHTHAPQYSGAAGTDLWADRYKPKSVKDIVGHTEQTKTLWNWLKTWKKGGALVTGPPGIGKTTTVHLVVAAEGYEVVELNASNERSATAVKAWFDEASRSDHLGKRRVVVMDEVDGMSSGDRGGVGELARIIKIASFPIICIANERTSPKLRPLSACCEDIRFQRPSRTVIAKALMTTVVAAEKLRITQAELEDLCERNGNDIRQILNFLQFSLRVLKSPARGAAKDELLRLDPFSATGRLFGRGGSVEDRSQLVFVDHGLVPLMVGEAYIAAAARSRGDQLANVIAAAEYMGTWDILDHKIHRQQAWGLLPAATAAVVGAATAAGGPAPFQIFPSWLGKASKRNKVRRWHRTLAEHTGGSTTALVDTKDVLRTQLFDKTATAPVIVDRLVSYGMTRDDMLETLAETVFTGDEASVALDTKLKGAITREWKKRGVGIAEAGCEDYAAEVLSDDEDDIEY